MAIPESIKQKANKIRNEVYGKDVREALASGIEEAGDIADQANTQVDNIQAQVNQLVVEGDSSVEAAQARVDAEGKSYPTLKARLDEKETQFSSQLASIEERKADKESVEQISSQLAQIDEDKADRIELESKVGKSDFLRGRLRGIGYPSNNENVTWSWWISNAIRMKGMRDKAFLGAVDRQGKQFVISYNYDTDTYERVYFDEKREDDHNAVAVVDSSFGRIHVFFTGHGGTNTIHYTRTTDIEGIDEFEPLKELTASGMVTYVQAFRFQAAMYLLYRINVPGATYWCIRRSADGGVSFGEEIRLFEATSMYAKCVQSRNIPHYLHVYAYAHPITGRTNNIYHCTIDMRNQRVLKYTNGAYVDIGATNDPNQAPITFDDMELAYDADSKGQKTRLLDATDSGRAFVFAAYTDVNDAEYYYRQYGSQTWQDPVKIADAGLPMEEPAGANFYFGGIAFLSGSKDVLYVSRENNGTWYMEKYRSNDGGFSFELEKVIDSSDTLKIFRPMCVVNGDEEHAGFYLKGQYTTYHDYRTDLFRLEG